MSDKPDNQPFVHLHLHTDYSLLDGCARVDRLMARGKELNMPAMAITDHGSLFGAANFFKAAKNASIKPIIGCEIYLVYDHSMDERPKRRRNRAEDMDDVATIENPAQLKPEHFPTNQIHHKTILARDMQGYRNLCKLVSEAHTRGVYYKPRVDMETLARYGEGLIGLSGCINGVASQYLIYNDFENAVRATERFVEIFGRENYYIELQDHGIPAQSRIIPGLLELAKRFDLKPVAANDVHYVLKGDWEPHDSLLCIQTGKRISDEDRMRYPAHEFYLKSYQEMLSVFPQLREALDNTLEVADRCNVELPFGEDHYPVFEKPVELSYNPDETQFDRILDIYVGRKNTVLARDGKEPVELDADARRKLANNGLYLFDLCKRGLFERYGIDYEATRRSPLTTPQEEATDYLKAVGKTPVEVCDQLDYELAIITGTGFVDYFLIVWDFINWARNKGIPVGPGRGSGAGCMVAYVLKITDIDPFRFGLLFERMLNLERVSPPDFDIDFCMRRRDDVVNYVRDKYGRDRVANIITYGTFGAKMIVRDLARVNDVPFGEADKLAKMIPDELNISLSDSVEKSSELRSEIKRNPIAQRIIEQGKIIEGMVRNTGKHACGVIIADQDITNLIPVTIQEGALTTQYAKGPSEELGLLKMDFLGLKNLTVISDCTEHIRAIRGIQQFDIEKVSLEDPATFKLLKEAKTVGVFQLESGGMQALCRQLEVSSIDEIVALIALYRPGPMQFIPQYIKGKKDPSTIAVPHPLLEELVAETYGVLVYQEQVMQAAQIIAGYTLGGADILRRAMGKKIKKVMDEQKQIFIQGAQTHNQIPAKQAEDIFAILEKFAQYGFNKSHSAAYAMISYRTAYLKANFPCEYMAALLSSELGSSDKVSHFVEEAKTLQIEVLGPDINESRENFTPIPDQKWQPETSETPPGRIRFGLAAIKGVGDSAAQVILTERDASGPFKDLQDFAERVDLRAVNRRVFEHLIKTGAFDFSQIDRQHLLDSLDGVISTAEEKARDREAGQSSLFDMMGMDNASAGDAGTVYVTTGPRMPGSEKLCAERELLGFYVSGHPMDSFGGLDQVVNTVAPSDDLTKLDREPFRLCGVAGSITKKLSRKDNRPWAFFTLSTKQANFAINVFSRVFETYGHTLEDSALLCVEGEIRYDETRGEAKLNANRLAPLTHGLGHLVEEVVIVCRNDDFALTELVETLHTTLQSAEGPTKLSVGIVIEETIETTDGVGFSVSNPTPSIEVTEDPEDAEPIPETESIGLPVGRPSAGKRYHLAVADIAESLRCKITPEFLQLIRRQPAVIGCRFKARSVQVETPSFGKRQTNNNRRRSS